MKLTRAKAIRLKCLDCCCGSTSEVALCTCNTCPLFPYRLGRKPKEEQELKAMANIENQYEKDKSEAQKQAELKRSEAMKEYWATQHVNQ